jgi:hypothetical protein
MTPIQAMNKMRTMLGVIPGRQVREAAKTKASLRGWVVQNTSSMRVAVQHGAGLYAIRGDA